MPILRSEPQDHRGFTLIECLLVVAIAAVLAAVAVPAYTEHLRRSHRSTARTTLLQAAHWLERAATTTGSYPDAAQIPAGILKSEGSTEALVLRDTLSVTVRNDRYAVTAATEDGQRFTLVAAPMAGTGQEKDKCGSLLLDQAGRRTVRNTALAAEDCWAR